ncbi:MAG TPA: Rpp14/Pop5 family protein [Candidatus Acidoferrum sp.]|nr:Rpp14/Pop5 family protein [Candidatus Acidoferrum sp.]
MIVDSTEAFGAEGFMDAVWSAIIRLYGEHGASQTWLNLMRYDKERKLAIIRVTNDASSMVRTALALATRICDKPASLHVVSASGTLKALDKKIKQYSSQSG